MDNKYQLKTEQWQVLIGTLKTRFTKHTERHSSLDWNQALARLDSAAGEKRSRIVFCRTRLLWLDEYLE